MFQSFFPRPKLFLLSALAWVAVAVALWYTQGEAMGAWFGFLPTDPAAEPVLGLAFDTDPATATTLTATVVAATATARAAIVARTAGFARASSPC